MKISVSYLRNLIRESPLGCLALAAALVSGTVYLARVEIPLFFLSTEQYARLNDDGPHFWVMILGSGIVFPLVLLSVAVEKRVWPPVAAIIFLFAAENILFPVMPFWTVMLLGGWSSWAVFFYITTMVIALVLLVRKAILGNGAAHFRL